MKTNSNIEANKALVLRFFSAIESNDLRVLDEIVAQDCNDHLTGLSPGRENLKIYLAGLHATFSGFKRPITAIVVKGEHQPKRP